MQIVFATGNKGKLKEAREIFSHAGILSVLDFDPSFNPEETGKTFLENAVIKAEAALKVSNGLAVLSDDSGLVVPSLGGAPGLYSARYGGVDGDHVCNRAKLLTEMAELQDRRAYFICTAVLLFPDYTVISAIGRCDGMIGHEERGTNGFGYDPLFMPDGETRMIAEMSSDEKNALSHRGRAFTKLEELLGRLNHHY